jgi:hypothetical protein
MICTFMEAAEEKSYSMATQGLVSWGRKLTGYTICAQPYVTTQRRQVCDLVDPFRLDR